MVIRGEKEEKKKEKERGIKERRGKGKRRGNTRYYQGCIGKI